MRPAERDDNEFFTDRQQFIEEFFRLANGDAGQGGAVLAYYGVGGIGKTALARKLCAELETARPPVPFALVDLEALPNRTQAYRETLTRFRTELARTHSFHFPRFDLCLTVLTAREGGDPEPLARINPTLKAVHDGLMGIASVPASAVAGFLDSLARKWPNVEHWIRQAGGTEEVSRLRRCRDQDLERELIRAFAEDIKKEKPRRPGKWCQCVLFLDTYESLWKGREAAASSRAWLVDEWVRALGKACLDSGILLVIHGRDQVRWAEREPEQWQGKVRQFLLGGLSSDDARQFLADKYGIGGKPGDPLTPLQDAIIRCCDLEQDPGREASCHPQFLELCGEIVRNTREATGNDPPPELFRGVPTKDAANVLAERFLKSLHNASMEGWVEELSLTPRFDEEAALAFDRDRHHQNGRAGWKELVHFSFVDAEGNGFYRLHMTMRDALRARLAGPDRDKIHAWFEQHWRGRDQPALWWFHRWSREPEMALDEWKVLHETAIKESRIDEARALLGWWSHIALDEADRDAIGGSLWARTHSVLGHAFWATPSFLRSTWLSAAISHHAAALRFWTQKDYPRGWAMTQIKLGLAFNELPTGNTAENQRRAIGSYLAALRVYTEQGFPQDWAMT